MLNLAVTVVLLAVLSSCANAQNGDGGGGGTPVYTKCIDNKPPPTPFSTQINALNHAISISQGITMIDRFSTARDSMLLPGMRNRKILPIYETFNLKAIDAVICQPNAVGFRVYLAMDPNQQVRLVLVGVDGDGKDIIQNTKENPGKDYASLGAPVLVEETGQRWP